MTTDGGPRRAVFRADATALIGGGHVMRCLTLADGLMATGWRVGFICTLETLSYFPALPNRLEVLDVTDWRSVDAASLARHWPVGCDVLVVDHYDLDSRFETACRGWAAKIVVIDDLADRRHDCDLLMDPTLGRGAEDYYDLVPADALVLTGPDYALLRSEFLGSRRRALARRGDIDRVERIFVSLGFTDVNGLTEQIVRDLLAIAATPVMDVVIGPKVPGRTKLEELADSEPRLMLHVDPPRIVDLMVQADLAVGGAGATSWERCCVGLPTILIVLADNQRSVARSLEAVGAAVATSTPSFPDGTGVATKVMDISADIPALRNMSRAAAALVDGSGTDRAVIAIQGLLTSLNQQYFRIRAAASGDRSLVWKWRNDPVTRANSRNSNILSRDDHDAWYAETMVSSDHLMLIGVVENEPFGVARFDRTAGSEFEVSINLASHRRGAGLGRRLLSCACAVFEQRVEHANLFAEIKIGNSVSRRLFEACGFNFFEECCGFVTYRRFRYSKRLPA
jgi:UDP-2,4-diacetamido-2,4,6-trideoxy-beta-L-altropyranose hydrolase